MEDHDAYLKRRAEEDALIQASAEAKALLESPVFINTVNRMSDYFTRTMFLTEPHEAKKREGLYYQAISLQAVVDYLAQEVTVGEEILHRREETKE